ncbi:MupG family TIM beta-alpha barrel fold protein [Mollicutes bacterium LVI A0078]|nr:MupG family TIM beta-alpha barrel fold protein [Mollicutes bacterium LVI A0075]WOO91373.1 MupG family TIM beta-alpha barrel fold protein [Mollicutes bacterium LVI A0078]
MFGFSIYKEQYNQDYVESLKKIGITNVFVSLHVTEDLEDKSGIIDYLKFLKEQNLNLIVDISPVTFKILSVQELKSFNINTVRLDYGFDQYETKELYDQFNLILNASTITEKEISQYLDVGIKLEDVTLMHNFYPKEETALSKARYEQLNRKFKKSGFKILSFVPGDKVLRGPIYKGLPTVEDHRSQNFVANCVELLESCDEVFVGDIELSANSISDLEMLNRGVIPIRITNINLDQKFINTPLKIRQDSNHLNLRIENSRFELKTDTAIPSVNTLERPKGTITQDNLNSLRYNGEIMITRQDMPAKENLNAVASVRQEYLNVLDCDLNGKTIMFTV